MSCRIASDYRCIGTGENCTWQADPFLKEVNEEIHMGWWCDSCWLDRKDQV